MSTKGRKTYVLEHWFGVDRVLFGSNPKSVLSEEDFTRYCVTKGAFLTNLYEIYLKVGFAPKVKFKNAIQMEKASVKLAEQSILAANKIMRQENVGKLVKEEIQEAGNLENLEETEVARYIVIKRRNAIAIDALTMGSAVKEGSSQINEADWQSKVILDAHKTLRDTLIDISLT